MWTYRGDVFDGSVIEDDGCVGFVYLITNETTGMKYIGKKLFTKSKTYQKNKKKRRMRVESDWMTYTGSNAQLNEDVDNGDLITKEILHLCDSRGWCSYRETQEILNREAIQSDQYYNGWVSCKIQRSHIK